MYAPQHNIFSIWLDISKPIKIIDYTETFGVNTINMAKSTSTLIQTKWKRKSLQFSESREKCVSNVEWKMTSNTPAKQFSCLKFVTRRSSLNIKYFHCTLALTCALIKLCRGMFILYWFRIIMAISWYGMPHQINFLINLPFFYPMPAAINFIAASNSTILVRLAIFMGLYLILQKKITET